MLPRFHIRNIQSPLEAVQISALCYDDTLSNEPRATLKYKDDDGDLITIGSSLELEQCLGEQTSLAQRRQLAELQKSTDSLVEYQRLHIFSIDSDEETQDVWRKLKNSGRKSSSTVNDIETVRLSEKSCKARRVNDRPGVLERNPNDNCFGRPNLEDSRTLYVGAAGPPQPCAPQKPFNLFSGKALRTGMHEDRDTSAPEKAGVLGKDQTRTRRQDHKTDFLTANLTIEGKRQAQLAGEKFRARGPFSRPRKMSSGPADRHHYHNRWALYNSTETPEVVPATGTSDAKRQAQAAGDSLHSKASRTHQAAKGVSNRGGIVDDGWDLPNIVQHPFSPQHRTNTSNVVSDRPSNLLELFESELAGKSHRSASQTEHSQFVPLKPPSASLMPKMTQQTNFLTSEPQDASSRIPSQAIENGIKTAVSGFELCFRGIVDALKTAQPCKSDNEVLAESSRVFQDLANKDLLFGEPPSYGKVQPLIHKRQTQTGHHGLDMKADVPQALNEADNSPTINERRNRQGQVRKQEDSDSLPSDTYAAADGQSQRKYLRFESEKLDSCADFTGPFQYHRPGPIHLPQNDPWMQTPLSKPTNGAVLSGIDSVEGQECLYPMDTPKDSTRPHQQQTVDPFKEGVRNNRSFSPSAVMTQFPTIGQFEGSVFLARPAASSLPTLIDLEAEEGPKPSRTVKSGDEANISNQITQTSEPIFNARIPQITAQLGSEVATKAHKDQSPNSTFRFSCGSVASDSRLPYPSDAMENVATPRDQLVKSTKPHPSSNTTKQLRTLRRPHSDVFSGNGRLAWDPVIGQQKKCETHGGSNAQASSTSLPLQAPSTISPNQASWENLITDLEISRSATNIGTCRGGHDNQSLSTNFHSHDAKIRKCINQLIALGFDMKRSRLRVYASVADGDLDEAIDIITEDQKVHDGWES